jgi:hypothetical protein
MKRLPSFRSVGLYWLILSALAVPCHAKIDPGDLVGLWLFDEGEGTSVKDSSGQENHGQFNGTLQWTEGVFGGALNCARSGHVLIPDSDSLDLDRAWTLALWVHINPPMARWQTILNKRFDVATNYVIRLNDGGTWEVMVNNGGWVRVQDPNPAQDSEWVHLSGVYDGESNLTLFVDGEQAATRAGVAPPPVNTIDLRLGSYSGNSGGMDGMIDETAIFNTALTAEDILRIAHDGLTAALGGFETAQVEYPKSGAVDIPRDLTLTWAPGRYAAKHNVYLGTRRDDVSAASSTDPRGVLVSEGQTANSFDPGLLAFETTYYWRVDEVNAAPDDTVYPGDVWDFTIEPASYAIPPGDVSVTASSMDPAQDFNNTINGSGLNENDAHSNRQEDMWLAAGTDITPWIQFEFTQIHKLDKVHVWNHNSQTEAVLGFGIEEALLEYSLDGETWDELRTVILEQASGAAHYTGMDVALGGITAKVIKITALSNHSMLGLPQKGLAEVRFYAIAVLAREPMPVDGSTTPGVEVTLDWRPGREAVKHEVVFSQDELAVSDGSAIVATVETSSYDLGTLDLGRTYFWKINEMNDLGMPPVYEGDLWTFLTPEYRMIDDFERYRAEEGLRIWEHWFDGFDNPADNGAVVGNGDDAEKSVVYEGSQSMPIVFNNTTAPQSEVTRYFDTPLDLTRSHPEEVGVFFRGMPAGLVENIDGSLQVSGIGADINQSTDEFKFVYKTLTGNGSITARIDDIEDVHEWAKAGLMMRSSLELDDVYVMGVGTPRNRAEIKYRDFPGGATGGASVPQGDTPLPFWIRVSRSGGTYTVERSFDGTTWEPILGSDGAGSQIDLLMIDPIYIGLCVTSHDHSIPCTARFSEIALTGNTSPGWQEMDMGVKQPDNGAAPLYMILKDTTGKSARFETDDPAATQASAWTLLSAVPGDLNVNLSQIDSITIGVGGSGKEGKVYLDAIHTHRAQVTPAGN